MHSSRRPTRAPRTLLTVIVACALTELSAGSALASGVPAKWVTAGEAKMSGSMTLKLNGSNAKSCTEALSAGSAFNGGSQGGLTLTSSGFGEGVVRFECTGATDLWFFTDAIATYNSGYFLTTESQSIGWDSPYGKWTQKKVPMPFTNAAGETPSHVTFSETALGESGGGTITATGTLNITGKNGSALTLAH